MSPFNLEFIPSNLFYTTVYIYVKQVFVNYSLKILTFALSFDIIFHVDALNGM